MPFDISEKEISSFEIRFGSRQTIALGQSEVLRLQSSTVRQYFRQRRCDDRQGIGNRNTQETSEYGRTGRRFGRQRYRRYIFGGRGN